MSSNKLFYFSLAIFTLASLVHSFGGNLPQAEVQVFTQPTLEDEVDASNADTNIRPRCGETYDSPTGGIFYKPFEQVEEHERCVWTIAVPSALGYSINVQFLSPGTNKNGSGQALVVTGLRWNNTEPVTLTNYVPIALGVFNVSAVNVLVVTFITGVRNEASPETGVVLEFEALYEGDALAISAASTQNIMESPQFEFKYPTTSSYAASELSTFIWTPNNHFYTGLQKHIWYKTNAMEGTTCNDALYVYKFNATNVLSEGVWVYDRRMCGGSTTTYITHDDIVLILFKSNTASNYAGFWFTHAGC